MAHCWTANRRASRAPVGRSTLALNAAALIRIFRRHDDALDELSTGVQEPQCECAVILGGGSTLSLKAAEIYSPQASDSVVRRSYRTAPTLSATRE